MVRAVTVSKGLHVTPGKRIIRTPFTLLGFWMKTSRLYNKGMKEIFSGQQCTVHVRKKRTSSSLFLPDSSSFYLPQHLFSKYFFTKCEFMNGTTFYRFRLSSTATRTQVQTSDCSPVAMYHVPSCVDYDILSHKVTEKCNI